ncbi:MAG: hypothetical protein LC663_02565, partial [Actinobacteria bacterium]|nr:hypothetical protein [Actinomycetota bacterium]
HDPRRIRHRVDGVDPLEGRAMRRLLATRYGFFSLAALICWALIPVTDVQFRWVAFGTGCLYVVLTAAFLLEEVSRAREARRFDRT